MRTYAPAEPGAVLDAPARGAVPRARGRPSRGPAAARRRSSPTSPTGSTRGSWRDSRSRGIERPYLHQAEAIEAVHAGDDVVVVTPTASGKSLCYTVPVLQAIADDPAARALFLFPTKALGQDQVAEFGELAAAAGLSVLASTYDGDTPAPIRSAVRAAGQVVVTNPDMLHSAILPHHTKWFQLFEQLQVHRHRRAAHVSRRVRQPRRQRAAPAAPDLRPLRLAPGHRLLLGDDREPGRAGGDADRATGTARRPERRTGRRAPRRPGRSADPRARPAVRAGRPSPSPSAGHCRSCVPGARRSCSGGRGSRSSCC